MTLIPPHRIGICVDPPPVRDWMITTWQRDDGLWEANLSGPDWGPDSDHCSYVATEPIHAAMLIFRNWLLYAGEFDDTFAQPSAADLDDLSDEQLDDVITVVGRIKENRARPLPYGYVTITDDLAPKHQTPADTP